MIKKLAVVSMLFLFGTLLFFSSPVKASEFDLFEGCGNNGTNDTSVCENKDNTDNPIAGTNGIIVNVVSIVSYFIGVIAVIMIIFAGFKYITSAGDANSVSTAKSIILYSVIGLAVAVFAQAIIIFVINRI